MAANVSAGNIHAFYLAGQVYRGQDSWSSGFTFKANPLKESSWYHFFYTFLIPTIHDFVTSALCCNWH